MKQFSFSIMIMGVFFLSSCILQKDLDESFTHTSDQEDMTSLIDESIMGSKVTSEASEESRTSKKNDINNISPIISVSDFGAGIEGASKIYSYELLNQDTTIKLHGSLIDIEGEPVRNIGFSYGREEENNFYILGESSSDEGGQYFINVPITLNLETKIFVIDIKIGEIVSRVFFIPDGLDLQKLLQEQENLPKNIYFTIISYFENTLIAGVDIVVYPQ